MDTSKLLEIARREIPHCKVFISKLDRIDRIDIMHKLDGLFEDYNISPLETYHIACDIARKLDIGYIYGTSLQICDIVGNILESFIIVIYINHRDKFDDVATIFSHEAGHIINKHAGTMSIKNERQAWRTGLGLCKKYGIRFKSRQALSGLRTYYQHFRKQMS